MAGLVKGKNAGITFMQLKSVKLTYNQHKYNSINSSALSPIIEGKRSTSDYLYSRYILTWTVTYKGDSLYKTFSKTKTVHKHTQAAGLKTKALEEARERAVFYTGINRGSQFSQKIRSHTAVNTNYILDYTMNTILSLTCQIMTVVANDLYCPTVHLLYY